MPLLSNPAHPFHAAIFGGWKNLQREPAQELSDFMHIPGIPLEWLANVFRWHPKFKREAMAVYNQISPRVIYQPTQEEGLEMLDAIRHPYKGAIPYWSMLALQATPTKDILKRFPISETRLQWWRTRQTYNPLTFERIIHPIGSYKNATYRPI